MFWLHLNNHWCVFFNFRWFYFKKGISRLFERKCGADLSRYRTVFFNGSEMSWCRTIVTTPAILATRYLQGSENGRIVTIGCRTVFFNGCRTVLFSDSAGSLCLWRQFTFLLHFPHMKFSNYFMKSKRGRCLRYIKSFVNTKIAFKLQSLITWHFFQDSFLITEAYKIL
jgi:hypothetical protein